MFIEPTITWVPLGFSGYIWLDTKIVLKKIHYLNRYMAEINSVDELINKVDHFLYEMWNRKTWNECMEDDMKVLGLDAE